MWIEERGLYVLSSIIASGNFARLGYREFKIIQFQDGRLQ